MIRLSSAFALMLGSAALLEVGVAVAQPRAAPCRDVDRTIDRALDMRRRGDDAGAFTVLQDLWARCPSPRLRAQIGLTEEALRRWGDAHEHLREALSVAGDPWIAARRVALEEVRMRAASHLAGIAPNATEAGTELWVGGRRAGVLPLAEPVLVEPGAVEIELRNGGRTRRHALTLREGETFRGTLTLDVPAASSALTQANSVATALPAAGSSAATASSGSAMRTAGLALTIVGSALAVGGAALWVVSFTQREGANDDERWRVFYHRSLTPPAVDASDACARAEGSASQAPNAEYVRDLCGRNQLFGTLALVSGVTGALALGAGVVLLATAPSQRPPPLRVSGSVTPSSAAAAITLEF